MRYLTTDNVFFYYFDDSNYLKKHGDCAAASPRERAFATAGTEVESRRVVGTVEGM